MAWSVKILFVKEDLSTGLQKEVADGSVSTSAAFEDVVRTSQPDAIVLNLSSVDTVSVGAEAVRKVRSLTALPLVVVSAGGPEEALAYRLHGATECVQVPVDIGAFATLMQELVRRSAAGVDKDARQSASQTEQVGSVSPEGVRLSLRGNIIRGPAQRDVLLTTAENRLLRTLAMRPWCVLSRAELGTAIYGAQQPANDRAVDVLVTRLRKKLMLAGGEAARALVKTEFRFGYSWTADALAGLESELQLRQGRAEMSVSQDPAPTAIRWATR